MKHQEFCYWLQGYFELRESPDDVMRGLSKRQWETIHNHLNLVKKVGLSPEFNFSDTLTPGAKFVTWLETVLETYEKVGVDSKALTQLVETKLNECFEHVIDKTYGGDPEELGKIHRPKRPKGVRC